MTNADKMLKIIDEEDVEVLILPFKGKTKGLYGDGLIAISDKVCSDDELRCVLAEELGHHKTSYGNILDMKNEVSRKQELRARGWAYNELIVINVIIDAFCQGCRSWYELSDFMGVTEEFLKDAIEYYKNKYGIYKVVGSYIVYFEPFGVMEMMEGL